MGASLPPKESNLFKLIVAVSKFQSVPNKFNGDRHALGTFAEIGGIRNHHWGLESNPQLRSPPFLSNSPKL
ncbi:hypothetical protein PHJA_001442900 [Phtheirospermum japonicum]|uniref:Uncharacterized protein n=1 Tax=Phtheirospermum japonicum TaxID=374723 RepID=A0A830C1J6_9LAMI|nr:hypothetical protein PHJA_001442900 [Phtheirospermum japonicum]